MKTLYSIGEFSQVTGLSVKTLRFYHEKGILIPDSVDALFGFPRKTLVFLDGEQQQADGCIILPGGDVPERVVFEALKANQWNLLDLRTGRDFSKIVDACTRAMTVADHHEWVSSAGRDLLLGGDTLWQMMASTWAENCLSKLESAKIVEPIRALLA